MVWCWQLPDWPKFKYDIHALNDYEKTFHHNAGRLTGAIHHLEKENTDILKVELLVQEALSTSSIEGEILNRDSVQSSIRKHLNLKTDGRRVPPNAAGISEMMVDLYLNFSMPLNHTQLYRWHAMLMNGRRDIESIGTYRSHKEPMQIISGNLTNPTIFYEAPPSERIKKEMNSFVKWYEINLINKEMPTLLLAGIAHIYFEMIHPFEDGNGRIGRALVEKVISQRLKSPALNSLAKVIEKNKKEYYQSIYQCNTSLDLQSYLEYFCKIIIDAQNYTYDLVHFLILKSKYFYRFQYKLNERQAKVLLRILDEGIEGFKGGLNAQKYQAISGASPATTTRDLQELVDLKALKRTGELKGTRYWPIL